MKGAIRLKRRRLSAVGRGASFPFVPLSLTARPTAVVHRGIKGAWCDALKVSDAIQ